MEKLPDEAELPLSALAAAMHHPENAAELYRAVAQTDWTLDDDERHRAPRCRPQWFVLLNHACAQGHQDLVDSCIRHLGALPPAPVSNHDASGWKNAGIAAVRGGHRPLLNTLRRYLLGHDVATPCATEMIHGGWNLQDILAFVDPQQPSLPGPGEQMQLPGLPFTAQRPTAKALGSLALNACNARRSAVVAALWDTFSTDLLADWAEDATAQRAPRDGMHAWSQALVQAAGTEMWAVRAEDRMATVAAWSQRLDQLMTVAPPEAVTPGLPFPEGTTQQAWAKALSDTWKPMLLFIKSLRAKTDDHAASTRQQLSEASYAAAPTLWLRAAYHEIEGLQGYNSRPFTDIKAVRLKEFADTFFGVHPVLDAFVSSPDGFGELEPRLMEVRLRHVARQAQAAADAPVAPDRRLKM